MTIRPEGEIYDLGYQRYDGPREGRWRPRKALWVNGVRTALGVGRGPIAWLLPGFLFLATIGPALLFVIIASIGAEAVLPGHADYYEIVLVILMIFSAVIAPDLLCPDRRDGVISLYLVRPLTPTDYVAARWLAFFTITLTFLYGGQFVLFIGLVLGAADPVDYAQAHWLDVLRFLAGGLVIAIFTTTIPLAIAAFTSRRALAAALTIGLYLVSSAMAGALTDCHEGPRRPGARCEPITGDAAKWFAMSGIVFAPVYLNNEIFQKQSDDSTFQLIADLPMPIPYAWYGLLTVGPGLLLWRKYERISL